MNANVEMEHPQQTEWEVMWAAHREEQTAQRKVRGPVLRSLLRGIGLRCPKCGKGKILNGYLKTNAACSACGEEFGHIRTDDFAPWLSILVVGHIMVSSGLALRHLLTGSVWVQAAGWAAACAVLTFLFLPRAKGLALGLMWSVGLTGSER